MKLSKAIRGFADEAKRSDSYWVESVKLQFALALERQRRSANMTYGAIAQKIGTSAAYITKVFRGDTNMTIETMVKLARATGGRLDVEIVDAKPASAEWSLATMQAKATSRSTQATSTGISVAENDDRFNLAA